MQTPNTQVRAHTHTDTELRQLTASAPRPQVQWWPLLKPHLPPVMFDSRGRIHHLLGSLGASQLLPRGIYRRTELRGTGLKPPQLRQQLFGRQTEVRHRCESLEPTEGTADFNISHVCYSTFSGEEKAGP